jgi:hypothetical protein
MDLPLGEWKSNYSGTEGKLQITSVNDEGIVLGKLFPMQQPIEFFLQGLWDNAARKLTFGLRKIDGVVETVVPIVFVAYLFPTPPDMQPGKDVIWTLCGSFQIWDLSRGVMFLTAYGAKRNVFGWYATTTKVD